MITFSFRRGRLQIKTRSQLPGTRIKTPGELGRASSKCAQWSLQKSLSRWVKAGSIITATGGGGSEARAEVIPCFYSPAFPSHWVQEWAPTVRKAPSPSEGNSIPARPCQ